jgi:hypothetical protein
MRIFHKDADGMKFRFVRLTFYDLVGIKNDNYFKNNLPARTHNEFFYDELRYKRSWNFYAVKRFKTALQGLVLAKKIIRMFMVMLMNDLINENDIYTFPRGNDIRLYVGARHNQHTKNYKYNPHTFGRDYGLLIRFSKGALRRLGRVEYYVKPTTRWRAMIEENIKKIQYLTTWQ